MAAAGSAPAIVVMKVREKAMMTPMRMTKSRTRMMRPREVFSAMASRSDALPFTARPSATHGVATVAAAPDQRHEGEGRHEAHGLELGARASTYRRPRARRRQVGREDLRRGRRSRARSSAASA